MTFSEKIYTSEYQPLHDKIGKKGIDTTFEGVFMVYFSRILRLANAYNVLWGVSPVGALSTDYSGLSE